MNPRASFALVVIGLAVLAVPAARGAVAPVAIPSPMLDGTGRYFYEATRGSPVRFDASGSFTNNAPPQPLRYEWDLNNDGVFSGAIANPTGPVVTPLGFAPVDVATDSPWLDYGNANWMVGLEQSIALRVREFRPELDAAVFSAVAPASIRIVVPEPAGIALLALAVPLLGRRVRGVPPGASAEY